MTDLSYSPLLCVTLLRTKQFIELHSLIILEVYKVKNTWSFVSGNSMKWDIINAEHVYGTYEHIKTEA